MRWRWFIFLFFSLLMTVIIGSTGMSRAQDSKDSTSSTAKEEMALPPPSLAEFVHLSSELAENLSELKKTVEKGFDLTDTEKSFAELSQKLQTLTERLQAVKADDNATYEKLAELKAAIHQEGVFINDEIESLTTAIRKAEGWRKDWLGEHQKWKKWQSSPLANLSISMVSTTFENSERSISEALNLISEYIEPLLIAQQKAEDIRYKAYKMTAELDALILSVRGDILQGYTPSMFSARYYAQLGKGWGYEIRRGLRGVEWPSKRFFVKDGWVIALQVLLTLAIAFLVIRQRGLIEKSGRWRFVADRPIAVGLTVSISFLHAFYGPAPSIYRLVIWALVCLSLARLMEGLTADFWKKWLVYGLAVLLLLTQALKVIGLPLPYMRVYVFLVSLISTVFFIWRSIKSSHRGDPSWYTWMLRAGGFFLAIVCIGEIAGYTVLALQTLDATLRTIFLLILIWALIVLVRGFLELIVQSAPVQRLSFMRENTDAFIRRSMFLLKLLIGASIITAILVSWRIIQVPAEAFQAIFSFGFTLGSTKITVGLILTALGILYGSFLISWTLQTVLMEDVLRRRQVEAGARISMARLLHYALVLIGFLAALAALGLDLRNVTIIGGALGVGIGFGLQTVVNNFVCGLILLFERPIKVEDVIQLGDQWGRVKKMGLRSTVVQTFDQAEVVVPNSDLIAGQVTNWTLADRRIRMGFPIGVAYGSNLEQVMETLQACADEHPVVLKDPPPQVLFSAFGDSSLDFQFRVWIADFNDRRQVQSELLLDIDRRFRELKIEIPFPQRDLHVYNAGESKQ